MQNTVALTLRNNLFAPANATAKHFAALNKSDYLTADAIDLIEKIGGFEIVVTPFVRGNGAMGSPCQVIRLPKKVA